MTKQTNKALWTKGSCLAVRCLIKSKGTCLLANFSVLCGSVTITTEIMQKWHGQAPSILIFPIFYLPPVNSLMRAMFSFDHNKNYIEEFAFTTKMKSRKWMYLCSRILNVFFFFFCSRINRSRVSLTSEHGGSRNWKTKLELWLILNYFHFDFHILVEKKNEHAAIQ